MSVNCLKWIFSLNAVIFLSIEGFRRSFRIGTSEWIAETMSEAQERIDISNFLDQLSVILQDDDRLFMWLKN